MSSNRFFGVLAAALFAFGCEAAGEVTIPGFPDGGLLRTGTPLTRDQLYPFEGMYQVPAGSKIFGDQVAIRTSSGTVSVLTDKNNGFSVLGSACLPDGRVVVEGYWQYPTELDAGLVRLFVDQADVADALCKGETPTPEAGFSLTGTYGDDNDFPSQALSFTWSHELKPWRHTFFNTAHHGACEVADHCGASPNSLETIRLAERIGSNAAEVDVRVTRDGYPVLFHDPTLSQALVRGVFCNGAVDEITLAELLGSCEYKYGEKIPTLEEALRMMVDETELEGAYLDVKTADTMLPTVRAASAMVTELADRNGNADPSDDRQFAPVVAITTDENRTAWHEAKTALDKEGLPIPPCLVEYDPNLAVSEGCIAWGPTWTDGPQADNVRMVQSHGVGAIFWTINQSDFMDDFLKEAKPNGIITGRASTLFLRYQTIGTVPPATGTDQ